MKPKTPIEYKIVSESDHFLLVQVPVSIIEDLMMQLVQAAGSYIAKDNFFLYKDGTFDLVIDNIELIKEKPCLDQTKEVKAPDMNTGANDTHEAMIYQSEKLEKN